MKGCIIVGLVVVALITLVAFEAHRVTQSRQERGQVEVELERDSEGFPVGPGINPATGKMGFGIRIGDSSIGFDPYKRKIIIMP